MTWAYRVRVVACAIVTVLTAASVTGAAVTQLRPSTLVLQKADVPASLVLTYSRKITNAQIAAQFHVSNREIAAWQRLTGYRTEFGTVNEPTRSSSGPIAIRSAVSICKTAAGAHAYYLSGRVPNAQGTWRTLRPRIGDESLLGSIPFTSDGLHKTEYSVGWRDGRVFANVDVSGIAGRIRPEQAIVLAQAQERKIARQLR